jgi:hypothetical protein
MDNPKYKSLSPSVTKNIINYLPDHIANIKYLSEFPLLNKYFPFDITDIILKYLTEYININYYNGHFTFKHTKFISVNGKKHGIFHHNEQYRNKNESNIVLYINDKKEGKEIKTVNDVLVSEHYWKNGKKHGKLIYYHLNKTIKHQICYQNGKKHGNEMAYFQNNNLWFIKQWKDDKKNGVNLSMTIDKKMIEFELWVDDERVLKKV